MYPASRHCVAHVPPPPLPQGPLLPSGGRQGPALIRLFLFSASIIQPTFALFGCKPNQTTLPRTKTDKKQLNSSKTPFSREASAAASSGCHFRMPDASTHWGLQSLIATAHPRIVSFRGVDKWQMRRDKNWARRAGTPQPQFWECPC